ncbi:MAG: hypothetical protein IJS19_00720 [Muribaculaceae bacterium]|nr:hypothetical protein [Muribaculaceae bacterium]
MKEYIFYTTEGWTIAPNDNVIVDNCQILGFASGITSEEARDKLLKDNEWIIDAGYNKSSIIAKQIVSG